MLFFELLQIAIGNRDKFSHSPTEGEWKELFALAQKQAMVGIAFRGVEQLPEAQRPPKALLLQWYMVTERIKARTAELDRKAASVANQFLNDGFPSIILKGQGIAQLYHINENENEDENCSAVTKTKTAEGQELIAHCSFTNYFYQLHP